MVKKYLFIIYFHTLFLIYVQEVIDVSETPKLHLMNIYFYCGFAEGDKMILF
jgi:hypothetical protein